MLMLALGTDFLVELVTFVEVIIESLLLTNLVSKIKTACKENVHNCIPRVLAKH